MIMEFPQARLLVFVKAPVPGQVKTRLTGMLGKRGAARLYMALLRHTLSLTTAANLCPIQLWCTPDTRHAFFTACRRDYGIELRAQRGKDLGWRMAHAFSKTLATSPYALLIGGDCASLEVAELRLALAALDSGRDAVLVPAEDGGYVLIGLHRSGPALFKGIRWGGKRVLAMTRRRLRRTGLNWLELPLGWDVDRPADVRRWKRLLDHSPLSHRGEGGSDAACQAVSPSPNDSVV